MADTGSIFANVNNTPYNPLTTIGTLQTLNNQQQQGQLLQTANQRQQVGLTSDQAALASSQYGYANKLIGDLAAQANTYKVDENGNYVGGISQKDIIQAAVQGVADGMIPKSSLDTVVNNLSQQPDNPAANASFVNNIQSKTLDAAKQHDMIYGTNGAVPNGAGTVLGVNNSPFLQQTIGAPSFMGGSLVRNELGPAQNATRTQQILPDPKTGQPVPTNVPIANISNQYGQPKVMGSQNPVTPLVEQLNQSGAQTATSRVAPPMAATQPPSTANTGLPTEEDINAHSKPATTATKSIAADKVIGNYPTEQPAGNKEDQEKQAALGTALQTAASSSLDRKALLNELTGIVKSGNVNLGFGSDLQNKIASGVQRAYGGESKDIAALDTFNKIASQISLRQRQDLGANNTDAGQQLSSSASPSSSISNRSNADILAMLKGNEDAINAKNSAWLDWKNKHGAGDFANFSNQYKRSPQVFQAPYMSPESRKTMALGMSAPQLAQFKQDYIDADSKGLINK